MQKYGQAAKYDFDNPAKWVTQPSVPLLDEHTMTNDRGQPVADVDRHALEQIASNNNRRVRETGDPATLILGHTSDDPNAPEKPAKGFVVNYSVRPYKRDPQTGRTIYAIHGDFKVRPKNSAILEEFPRRSVELWWHKKELDPIALLGGTSPERDLSVVIRNARLNHVALGKVGGANGVRDVATPETDCVRFSVRGTRTVEWYEIEDARPIRRQRREPNMAKNGQPRKYNHIPTDTPIQYAGDESFGDYDGGDSGGDVMPPDDGTGGGDDDPVVAKVMQSKWAKGLSDKLDMILEALQGDAGGTGGPGEGAPGEEMPPPGPGGGMGVPPGGGGDEFGDEPTGEEPFDRPEEEDTRRAKGSNPVQFSGVSNMAGPRSTSIPTAGKRFARPVARTNADPEVAKLRRQVKDMQFKMARVEAEKAIAQLSAEGVIFGDSAEEHAATVQEQTDYCAYLYMRNPEDFQHEIDVMRKRYRRKRPNPAAPASVGVARYARNGTGADAAQTDEDWEPRNPMEATAYADLVTGPKPMSRTDAIKYMRKNREAFAEYDGDVQSE